MNPHSTSDIIYHGLSEADRERLYEDVSKALKKGAEEIQGLITKEVEKAVTQMYSQICCNPWPQIVRDNAGQYEFIEAIRKSIWDAMKTSSPSNAGQWDMREMVSAWKQNFPEDWKEIVGQDAAKEIETLKSQLEFERSLRNRY